MFSKQAHSKLVSVKLLFFFFQFLPIYPNRQNYPERSKFSKYFLPLLVNDFYNMYDNNSRRTYTSWKTIKTSQNYTIIARRWNSAGKLIIWRIFFDYTNVVARPPLLLMNTSFHLFFVFHILMFTDYEKFPIELINKQFCFG